MKIINELFVLHFDECKHFIFTPKIAENGLSQTPFSKTPDFICTSNEIKVTFPKKTELAAA